MKVSKSGSSCVASSRTQAVVTVSWKMWARPRCAARRRGRGRHLPSWLAPGYTSSPVQPASARRGCGEMVTASDSKSDGGNPLPVRVRPPAPNKTSNFYEQTAARLELRQVSAGRSLHNRAAHFALVACSLPAGPAEPFAAGLMVTQPIDEHGRLKPRRYDNPPHRSMMMFKLRASLPDLRLHKCEEF